MIRKSGWRRDAIRRLGLGLGGLLLFAASGFGFVGATAKWHAAAQLGVPQHADAALYVCPRHPTIRSLKTGRCPRCHQQLELVRKEDGITVGGGAHHDHRPKHGGMLGMVEDYHLELVETPAEFRVYVYDAFTQPVSTAGVRGTIAMTNHVEGRDATVSFPLVPTHLHDCLAVAKSTTPTAPEVTLKIIIDGQALEMTFPRPRQEPRA